MPVSRATGTPIHTLRVTLRGSRPAIWRRVEVRSTMTLPRLHATLQAPMGWLDYHLFAFVVNGVAYGDPALLEEITDEDDTLVRLRDVAPQDGTRSAYNDDFGDDRWLDLVVEAVGPPDPAARCPRRTADALATPPEDGGGIRGHADFRRAIRHPRHPDHDDPVAWSGGRFDPAAFDVPRADARLRGPWPRGHPPVGDRRAGRGRWR
jgi:hypothetical protein